MPNDKVNTLKENMGEALKSLLAQRKVLLARHKGERNDINKKIKEVEENIVGANKYHKH